LPTAEEKFVLDNAFELIEGHPAISWNLTNKRLEWGTRRS
jgi:hypothetical protein